MDIYRNYAHTVPSSKPSLFSQPIQQSPWLSRPKEERLLLRSANPTPAPFQLGGPGTFPRRNSLQRPSFNVANNPLSSSSMSAIDPYASPVTAEDLRNRYLRDNGSGQQQPEGKDEKVQERTYMSTTPNPFLMNGFLRRQGSLTGERPSSASSLPGSLRSQRGAENGRGETIKKPLVESGVLKPRRPITAAAQMTGASDEANSKSSFPSDVSLSTSAKLHPPTNPMTMFSVVTKKYPQRMVEHSTSVFAKPPPRPSTGSQPLNMQYTPGKPYNLCSGALGEREEKADGIEVPEIVVEGAENGQEASRMPVTGTLTSTVFYRKSSKCEELIYRPQTGRQTPENSLYLPEKETPFSSSQSESLYDKVKREVENHRKARQLAKDREKEMDDRQRQIQSGKMSSTIATKVTAVSRDANSMTNESVGSEKAKLARKPPTAPTKEVAPPSLSSNAGSLAKAILPGRIPKPVKVSENASNVHKNSLTSKTTRLSVTKQRSGVRKDEGVEDEGAELGERQPGDGEADIDDEKSIRTEYSNAFHTRSASSCSTVLTIQSDQGSCIDDSNDDEEATNFERPLRKRTRPVSASRSRSASRNRHVAGLGDDDDDDDVTNIDSDSDSDTTIDSVDHRIDDTILNDTRPPTSRRAKSRSLPTLSSDSDSDDSGSDTGYKGDEKRRASISRRSRSVSRLSTEPSPDDSCGDRLSEPSRPRSAAGLPSPQHLNERYGKKNSSGSKKGKTPLMPSCFDNVPPSIRFVTDGQKIEPLPWKWRKYLVWRMSTITPVIVKQTIWRSGFRASKVTSVIDDLETHESADWIGYFGKHMKAQNFKSLREYQKYNHYPGSFQLGRKDRLWQNLYHMQQLNGKKEYNFFPQTFCLPMDTKLLKKVWDDDGGHKMKWIIKPPASARGQGIRVVHQWCQIPKKSSVIVQKYLSHPYLINDSKFDLRVYVYVPSFDPLRIYIHEDGLVRFASQKYSTSVKNLGNRFMHLTNYSVNKQNTEYQSNSDDQLCQGHKWSLRSLWTYLRRKKINTDKIWDQIKDVIVKTIIGVETHINAQVKAFCRRKYCVHELFGFDILLDESLQPWVLECNISPSLHSNSKLDINVKGEMIKDMFNIAGYQIPDRLETGAPSSSYTPSSDIVCDRRLWYSDLGPDEKEKQEYFRLRAKNDQSFNGILDIITPEDLRILIESVDEYSRAGSFEQVFPTAYTRRYLKFFESVRYSNLLLQTYMQRFNNKSEQGLKWLNSMCQKRIHLTAPAKDPRHRWKPPNEATAAKSSSPTPSGDARATKYVTRAV